jgi:hypothetical protein
VSHASGDFPVMRRKHASLMKELDIDPKLVADQLGHSLNITQNVHLRVSVEHRRGADEQLEAALIMLTAKVNAYPITRE